MLEQFAEVFDLYSDYDIVESAHMEIAEPTILQAAEKCIQKGATSVVIAPYFLSRCSVPPTTDSCCSIEPQCIVAACIISCIDYAYCNYRGPQNLHSLDHLIVHV